VSPFCELKEKKSLFVWELSWMELKRPGVGVNDSKERLGDFGVGGGEIPMWTN
jgi:hypothetical protein